MGESGFKGRFVMKIFDRTVGVLQKSMDLHYRRHAVLSSNIANSETPNFRAREVDFAGELAKAVDGQSAGALKVTNSRHLDITGSSRSAVILDHSQPMKADGNNVDLDLSLGKISENARAYNGAANYLTMKFRVLRQAAMGQGGM